MLLPLLVAMGISLPEILIVVVVVVLVVLLLRLL